MRVKRITVEGVDRDGDLNVLVTSDCRNATFQAIRLKIDTRLTHALFVDLIEALYPVAADEGTETLAEVLTLSVEAATVEGTLP